MKRLLIGLFLISLLYSCSKKSSGPTKMDVLAKASIAYDLTQGNWIITLTFNPTISNAAGEATVIFSGYQSGQYVGRNSIRFNYSTGNAVTNTFVFNTKWTHSDYSQADSAAVTFITCPSCNYNWHY